jgi:hypothetical protein
MEHLAHRFAVLLENRSLTRRAIGWAAANWLLDAASLWVFVAAFSHFISPVDLLMAYGLANILAAIPITPGGLGVVEFVLVTMITGFGPTAGQALSAVLAYRAVNFWLPIPFGGMAYASLEFERRPTYRKFQHFVHRRREFRLAAESLSGGSGVAGEPELPGAVAPMDGAPRGLAPMDGSPRGLAPADGAPRGVTPAAGGPLTAAASGPPPDRTSVRPPAPESEAAPASTALADGNAPERDRGPRRSAGPTLRVASRRGDGGGIREPAFGSDPAG